jgi:hypothetical protein
MFSYNTDPIIELMKSHQKTAQNEAHLRHLLRVLRRRSRKRIKTNETLKVSCTIYPTEC